MVHEVDACQESAYFKEFVEWKFDGFCRFPHAMPMKTVFRHFHKRCGRKLMMPQESNLIKNNPTVEYYT